MFLLKFKFCFLAVETFFKPETYLSMDIIVNGNETCDIANGNKNITFDRMKDAHTYGVINNALCFYNLTIPIDILNSPFQCSKECVFSLWLKHYCEYGEDKRIFTTSHFTLQCSSTFIDENSTKAVVDIVSVKCKYSFQVSGGFWYFLAINFKQFEDWDIYVNGNKADYLKKCEYITLPDTAFEVHNSSELCIDEIMFQKQSKTEKEIKELYNFYISGEYDQFLVSF